MSKDTVKYTDEPIQCFHCGNQTVMQMIAQYNKQDFEEIWPDHFSEHPDNVIHWFNKWTLYLCPVCTEVTLFRTSGDSEYVHPNGEPITVEELLYPSGNLDKDHIPEPVHKAYMAAIGVRNIDGAVCVLALRRALEKMCKHEGATGRDLFSKLKNLQEIGKLPPIMDQISFILRKEGNSAAHADDIDFDKETVNQLIDFTEVILEYLYTLPHKIKQAQLRLQASSSEPKVSVENGAENGAAEEIN